MNLTNTLPGHAPSRRTGQWALTVALLLDAFLPVHLFAAESTASEQARPVPRLGFYLHACWDYEYPFAVKSWQREDFSHMFQFLKEVGFDTVMLWPLVENVPVPLADADARDLRAYRPAIDDARAAGLECWLTFCPNLTVRSEVASQPLHDRVLMPNLRVIRFDEPADKAAYLEHRARILSILNNADGYVTIDGDPGGYAGARPEDFVSVFQADHQTLQRHGTHPQSQKVIPWIWCGWGTRGVWQEPIKPFVEAELKLLQKDLPEPNEFLIGQCRSPFACRRINVALAEGMNLAPRSTMMCYESVEYEPAQPASKLQFEAIRDTLREERSFLARARGAMCNAQTPITVLPNIYFFARAFRDTNYLAKADAEILRDFALAMEGPPELLVPAWSCLRLPLEALPADLPSRLRAAELRGDLARHIPGGPKRYLEILAAQVQSRRELLLALNRAAANPEAAANGLADGAAALIQWWKQHRYAGEHDRHHPFAWSYVDPSQLGPLKKWAAANARGNAKMADRAAARLSDRGVLTRDEAKARIAELCAQ
jgi:hypothetical protein